MSTIETLPRAVPAQDIEDLEAAIADVLRGVRDSKKMEAAGRELDAGREEIRRRIGETDLAAELTDRDE